MVVIIVVTIIIFIFIIIIIFIFIIIIILLLLLFLFCFVLFDVWRGARIEDTLPVSYLSVVYLYVVKILHGCDAYEVAMGLLCVK